MSTPTLTFLGWDKPAIELVAGQLECLNAEAPAAFRRATVVVPTAESGRRLREYMAERAGKPVLMPRIILAGQLIPCRGENIASDMETMAAWLHVLSGAMGDKPLPWMLEVATQMQRIRKQLEQEARTPEWQSDSARSFVQDYLQEPGEAWEQTLHYEQERWETLRTSFAAVDARLSAWGRIPSEQSRAEELAQPTTHGMVIIACVPELSPLNRLYLQRLADTGAARVEIWVNAPAAESARFDLFGQPLPVIPYGPQAGMGWSECPIEIPQVGNSAEKSHSCIHPTGSVQAFGRKVRELAGGCRSDEVVLASCDNSLSPMLISAFLPEWQINMPEGRSLLATEAGRLPLQLKNACTTAHEEQPRTTRTMEDFLELLQNRLLQRLLAPTRPLLSFNRFLTELCFEHLPGSTGHLRHLLQRGVQGETVCKQTKQPAEALLRHYLAYTDSLIELVNDCQDAARMPARLLRLASALEHHLNAAEWKRAVRILSSNLREAARLVTHADIACPPQVALLLLAHSIEHQALGALEGAGERDHAINLRGWRELCFARAPKLILAGMHDGYIPERMPADAYLPNAYRGFLHMTSDTDRCARDSFLLTALLHSRPAGAVHFVLSACTSDGTPIAPSSLLLRCNSPAETAARVSWLFSDPQAESNNDSYDLLPFITPAGSTAAAEAMESTEIIAPGVANRYADPKQTFSPSAIRNFLNCPLRFWLDCLLHVAPGDALEESKSEPDAAEYGTLLHAILQDITTQYANTIAGTDCLALAGEIASYATECTVAHLQAQYGDAGHALPIPLRILHRNLNKTVQEFARLHARDLCDGWEVVLREEQLCFSLPAEDGAAPLLFDMRVDRVDRHRDDGRLRVIDYKTNDTDPRATHWEKLSDQAAALYKSYMPAAMVLQDTKGNTVRWSSVQLPLYAEALRQIHQLPVLPETAFYNLPRSKPGTVTYSPMAGPDKKDAMNEELHAQAMACVQAAAALMRAGKCLYSAESLGRSEKYNSFGALSIFKDPDPRILCSLPALPQPQPPVTAP